MQSGAYLSLAIYFIAMFSIGIYAYSATKGDLTGFMLGGRNLNPAVTALSAGASDMSGWMLLGLPGAMYISGLSSAWIALGLTLGAYLNYLLVAPRLRVFTELLDDAVTIPEYFERRFDDRGHLIRILSSVVIIIFFAIYTTSGVVAGGKLFESSFGLNYELGLFITAGVVVAYSTFGGFLAVSTTDFVQGCIMFLALILVPIVTLNQIGSVAQTQYYLMELSPAMLTLGGGSLLGILSAASWGLGYFGQPHIIVRFMAIRSVREIKIARRIGMSWMIISLTGAIAVGLVGAAYIKSIGGNLSDPETIFIFLSNTLFDPLISGFLLAAILAAIMSTISSQLLVTSCSLTEDIYHTFLRKKANDTELVLVGRFSIVAVALLAIFLAHNRDSSILSLVSNAWAGFGAAFGPVVLLSLFWARMTRQGALAGIVVGASAVLFWIYGDFTINNQTPSDYIYEIVPGFFAGVIAIVTVSLLTKSEHDTTSAFNDMEDEMAHRLS
ncbi:MAG: sodium/proline symporter PutP [Halioglobus sp.]|nr:sodium/proline symporter PutP [Halioglobus sp.]